MTHVDRVGAVFDRERDTTLHRGRELTYVAGPLGTRECGPCRIGEREVAPRALRGGSGDVFGEERDVVDAIAQRRHADREHV